MNVSASKKLNESNLTKLYSIETNEWSFLAVPIDGQLNKTNNESYDVQLISIKIITRITIIIDRMSMYFSIKM